MNELKSISIEGFKAIGKKQTVNIAPLTILAGANSSGKSSFMQPLLLIKQTIDSAFDAGPLLLNGANVKFTSANQLFSRVAKENSDIFRVTLTLPNKTLESISYKKHRIKGLDILDSTFSDLEKGSGPDEVRSNTTIKKGMRGKEIANIIPRPFNDLWPKFADMGRWEVVRKKALLGVDFVTKADIQNSAIGLGVNVTPNLESICKSLIHIPGLRGNPARTYRKTAVDRYFPGTFEKYTASIIAAWQSTVPGRKKIKILEEQLAHLGLTWKVETTKVDDTTVELQVARLPVGSRSEKSDLVNIADVGLGISQTLPVIVSLITARKGQIVYIEQPEIHLHPKAQLKLASIIAKASSRGVTVIIETHSSLLIRGIQTYVAQSKDEKLHVLLHWFKQDNDTGQSLISSNSLDSNGAFGEWPSDFDDITLSAEQEYLDAVEANYAK